MLFTGKGKEMIQSCAVVESFYPLRLDYARLSHAALMATACLRVIQPEEEAGHLFILLARSLRRLAFEDLPVEAVTAAFLLHFVTINGFKPRLNHCSRCSRAMGEEGGYLLAEEDGICCLDCGRDAPRRSWLSAAQLSWLRAVLTRPGFTVGELKVLRGILASLDYYSPDEPRGTTYPARKAEADEKAHPPEMQRRAGGRARAADE